MAAVAGSKGKIEWDSSAQESLQIDLVRSLVKGEMSPNAAADILMRNAMLREVGVDTNMVCNLSCSYCYLGDRVEEKGTVPEEELSCLLGQAIDDGAKLIAFIGKEPLADYRALNVMASLQKHSAYADGKIRLGMVTNGTLIEKRLEKLLSVSPCYIDISVDGIGDQANSLRGQGVSRRILTGVRAIVASSLRSRFATATVLTKHSIFGYADFVRQMFEMGVPTCFASPVLRFAMSKEVADEALSLQEIRALIEQLSKLDVAAGSERQIIIDMPYKYTWAMLGDQIDPAGLKQDKYEAIYWSPDPSSNIFVKLNPFSFSFWRALRITHDGNILYNMDLAAHAQYKDASGMQTNISDGFRQAVRSRGTDFHREFIASHLAAGCKSELYERDLSAQFNSEIKQLAV